MFEIRVKISCEEDLYNPLDPEAGLLSDEVVSYIVRRYNEKPDMHEAHRIRIISDVPVDENRVRRNFAAYTRGEGEMVARKVKASRRKQLFLFLIGIAFIALWLLLAAATENILVEVLSIIGSFAVWEAANIWIVEIPEMRLERMRLSRLEKTEIVFETSVPEG